MGGRIAKGAVGAGRPEAGEPDYQSRVRPRRCLAGLGRFRPRSAAGQSLARAGVHRRAFAAARNRCRCGDAAAGRRRSPGLRRPTNGPFRRHHCAAPSGHRGSRPGTRPGSARAATRGRADSDAGIGGPGARFASAARSGVNAQRCIANCTHNPAGRADSRVQSCAARGSPPAGTAGRQRAGGGAVRHSRRRLGGRRETASDGCDVPVAAGGFEQHHRHPQRRVRGHRARQPRAAGVFPRPARKPGAVPRQQPAGFSPARPHHARLHRA